jgi:hypothetical protein
LHDHTHPQSPELQRPLRQLHAVRWVSIRELSDRSTATSVHAVCCERCGQHQQHQHRHSVHVLPTSCSTNGDPGRHGIPLRPGHPGANHRGWRGHRTRGQYNQCKHRCRWDVA